MVKTDDIDSDHNKRPHTHVVFTIISTAPSATSSHFIFQFHLHGNRNFHNISNIWRKKKNKKCQNRELLGKKGRFYCFALKTMQQYATAFVTSTRSQLRIGVPTYRLNHSTHTIIIFYFTKNERKKTTTKYSISFMAHTFFGTHWIDILYGWSKDSGADGLASLMQRMRKSWLKIKCIFKRISFRTENVHSMKKVVIWSKDTSGWCLFNERPVCLQSIPVWRLSTGEDIELSCQQLNFVISESNGIAQCAWNYDSEHICNSNKSTRVTVIFRHSFFLSIERQ